MSSKKTKAVNGALLGAAATALTVHGAMASPLGGTAPVGQLKHTLEAKKQLALEQSSRVLARAQTMLSGAIVGVPAGTASSAPSRAIAPVLAQPGHSAVQVDPPARGDQTMTQAMARNILREAALRHQLDPKLVLALSYWESGWDQSLVSQTGAIGLMQVEPATAQEAGPSLLGRGVDITDPYDNADVGTAILREDFDAFTNPSMALAAYYQGPTSLRAYGMLPDTQRYVDGILSLASRM
jgi:soluble lytic murein transglycosylase-like protein